MFTLVDKLKSKNQTLNLDLVGNFKIYKKIWKTNIFNFKNVKKQLYINRYILNSKIGKQALNFSIFKNINIQI